MRLGGEDYSLLFENDFGDLLVGHENVRHPCSPDSNIKKGKDNTQTKDMIKRSIENTKDSNAFIKAHTKKKKNSQTKHGK